MKTHTDHLVSNLFPPISLLNCHCVQTIGKRYNQHAGVPQIWLCDLTVVGFEQIVPVINNSFELMSQSMLFNIVTISRKKWNFGQVTEPELSEPLVSAQAWS